MSVVHIYSLSFHPLFTERLEDSLPGNINSGDHREILSLLCKVHELEIENTESQSAMLLKDYEMRKKDMIIERLVLINWLIFYLSTELRILCSVVAMLRGKRAP